MAISTIMKKSLMALAGATCIAFGASGAAQAASFTLTATNQGWWSTSDSNSNSNSNYFTGQTSGKSYRNFFTFDLAGLPGSEVVTSAILKLQRATGSGNLTHTLGLFDVSTSAATLAAKANNPNLEIYNDLGTGTNYGTYTISTSGNLSEIIDFDLNANAISDINVTGRFFSLGGALLDSLGSGEQYLFGFSGNTTAQLVVNTSVPAIPTPALLPGLIGLSISLLRKHHGEATKPEA